MAELSLPVSSISFTFFLCSFLPASSPVHPCQSCPSPPSSPHPTSLPIHLLLPPAPSTTPCPSARRFHFSLYDPVPASSTIILSRISSCCAPTRTDDLPCAITPMPPPPSVQRLERHPSDLDPGPGPPPGSRGRARGLHLLHGGASPDGAPFQLVRRLLQLPRDGGHRPCKPSKVLSLSSRPNPSHHECSGFVLRGMRDLHRGSRPPILLVRVGGMLVTI